MSILISDLAQRLANLARTVAGLPRTYWGEVVGTDPVEVPLDGAEDTITGLAVASGGVSLESRVLVQIQAGKATIIGGTDPNSMVVDGVAYEMSGTVTLSSVAITATQGSMFRTSGTVDVPMIQTPPSGWGYTFPAARRSGTIPVYVTAYGSTATNTPRVMISAPSSLTTDVALAWRLSRI